MISVIVLTYNQEQFINKALDGILMQKVDDRIEIVIGDDHSTDRTHSICQQYKLRYPNLIRLHYNNPNLGLVKNFIKMLYNCRGEYIALCDGDDYWTDENKLQKQLNMFRIDSSLTIVHTSRSMLDENGKLYLPDISENSATNVKDLFFHYPITTVTAMFKSEPIKAWLPEYERLSVEHNWKMQDLPLWLFLGTKGKIGFLRDDTSVYRVLKNTLSREQSKRRSYEFDKSVIDIKSFFYPMYNVGDKDFENRYHEMEFHARKRLLLNYGWMARSQFIQLFKFIPYLPFILKSKIKRMHKISN